MKKSILNLEGVEQLSKNEQRNVNGGLVRCTSDSNCRTSDPCAIARCIGGYCRLERIIGPGCD